MRAPGRSATSACTSPAIIQNGWMNRQLQGLEAAIKDPDPVIETNDNLRNVEDITSEEALRWLPSIINYYLNVLHPSIPLIGKSHLVNLYDSLDNALDFPFFCALGACIVAVNWWNREALSDFPNDYLYARQLSTYYFMLARSTIEDSFDTPSLYNVLTLVSMQIYCFVNLQYTKGKSYAAHARRMLQIMEPSIGTRNFPDTADMDPSVERELFTRINWLTLSMVTRYTYLLKNVQARKTRHAPLFYDMMTHLDLPKPLAFEDDVCRLTVRAYAHILRLSKMTAKWNSGWLERIRQFVANDVDESGTLRIMPIDVYTEIEESLQRFYDELDDDLNASRENSYHSAILHRPVVVEPSISSTGLYEVEPAEFQCWRLPQPCSSDVHYSRELYLRHSHYSGAQAHHNTHIHSVLLACEVHFSVAQLQDTNPTLAKQSQRHLITAINLLRNRIAELHRGNFANYTIRLWENGSHFKKWLDRAGIDISSLDWDSFMNDLIGPSSAFALATDVEGQCKQNNAVLVSWLYKPFRFPYVA
ncbi:hypothetical protein BZG36_02561 [Bifiguratus adelaidae]|uniref:Transcription factor domain-containing protein n=1 Tax=Bifiguratus adelaidae TaxID=1938954 RepID=A0A261Y238_9FUNG|nr:hypothetical protein BZG36_02561 [Bifiguratus adelaidae]